MRLQMSVLPVSSPARLAMGTYLLECLLPLIGRKFLPTKLRQLRGVTVLPFGSLGSPACPCGFAHEGRAPCGRHAFPALLTSFDTSVGRSLFAALHVRIVRQSRG